MHRPQHGSHTLKILAAGVGQLERAWGEQLQLVQRLDQLASTLHFSDEVLQELDHLVQLC